MMGLAMGELVNLRQFKKRAGREQAEKKAAANRVRFGRTRTERILDERRASHADEHLDQHRINGEDAS